MIDAYKNLLIARNGDGDYCIYKNGSFTDFGFSIDSVNSDLHNLFEAAPIMYTKLDQLATSLGRVSQMMEPVASHMDEGSEAKQLFTNIVDLTALMRHECLKAMHAAEVGMAKSIETNKNSE
jgi:hypothetical protein